MSSLPLISILTLVPILGGIAILLFGAGRNTAKHIALGSSAVAGLLAIVLWTSFDPALKQLQFVERHLWLPSMGIEYFVGIDGLGLVMVLLAAIVVPFAIAATGEITDRPQLHFALQLFLQAGLFGSFTALNFFHWFIFWELSLIPAFFLVKLWGGPNRTSAAYQFFVYTLVGSVAMLLAFLALYAASGTFDFIQLAELSRNGTLMTSVTSKLHWPGVLPEHVPMILFAGAFLGFAVKVPVVPFHTWLPATYSEAPTSVSMVLTGAMSKMGVYGFLRIVLPIFPHEMNAALPVLMWLAVATILASSFAALAQQDLKRIVAYSSINHLGYCLLGIFAVAKLSATGAASELEKTTALNGVVLQMFNHGITAAALFCFVGLIESRSGGARSLSDFGGLRKVAPVFCGLMGITLFSSIGLPGLNGFVGEFLIFKGAFGIEKIPTAVSALGLLVTAVFFLGILQRVWSGPLASRWPAFPDLTTREKFLVAPVIVLMFVLGVCPQLLIGLFNGTMTQLTQHLKF